MSTTRDRSFSFPKENVQGLLADIEKRISPHEVEQKLGERLVSLLRNGKTSFSEDEIWPLCRIAIESGILGRIPANGLQGVSYHLLNDVSLDEPPLGSIALSGRVKMAVRK